MEGSSRELYKAVRDDYVTSLEGKVDTLRDQLARVREENDALHSVNGEQADHIELLESDVEAVIEERDQARRLACAALGGGMPEYPDPQQPEGELIGAVLAGPGKIHYTRGREQR